MLHQEGRLNGPLQTALLKQVKGQIEDVNRLGQALHGGLPPVDGLLGLLDFFTQHIVRTRNSSGLIHASRELSPFGSPIAALKSRVNKAQASKGNRADVFVSSCRHGWGTCPLRDSNGSMLCSSLLLHRMDFSTLLEPEPLHASPEVACRFGTPDVGTTVSSPCNCVEPVTVGQDGNFPLRCICPLGNQTIQDSSNPLGTVAPND